MTDTAGASSDDTLRSAVAALLPEFRARAAEGEQLRTMPTDLVRRAQAAGLFRLNLPRSLGGFELDPATTAEIFEEISRADGVDRVFRLAGADAVYAHHPPQRCFRDVHAAGQHILFSTGRDQAYAKVCLGIGQPTFLI